MRYTAVGDPVAHLSLATTETWKDKASGEKREATEWHRVVLYRKLAEIAGEYLKKGSHVYLEGKLQTRKWSGKDGVERSTTEIITNNKHIHNTQTTQQEETRTKEQNENSAAHANARGVRQETLLSE